MKIRPTNDIRSRQVAGMWARWEAKPEFRALKYGDDLGEEPAPDVVLVDITLPEIKAMEGMFAKYAGRQWAMDNPAIKPYLSISVTPEQASAHCKKIFRVLGATTMRGYPRLGTVQLSRATLIHEVVLGNLRSRWRPLLKQHGIDVSDHPTGTRWWLTPEAVADVERQHNEAILLAGGETEVRLKFRVGKTQAEGLLQAQGETEKDVPEVL